MDEQRLTEIEERERAATLGPWTEDKPGVDEDGWQRGVVICGLMGRQYVYANPPGGQFPAADKRFIAHARADVPALIAAVREQKLYIEMSGNQNGLLKNIIEEQKGRILALREEISTRDARIADLEQLIVDGSDRARRAADVAAARIAELEAAPPEPNYPDEGNF